MDDNAGPTKRSSAYLPAGRAVPGELARQLAVAAESPVVDALLRGGASAMAVLNAERQVVAVNDAYLALAGVQRPRDVLGLRPGEGVRCIHAAEGPDGCGTGPACSSCGAAIALLVAGHRGRVAERDCSLAARGPDGREVDLEIRVRAAPLSVDGEPFLLFTLTDVSAAHRREAMERAFLHDLGNLVCGLHGAVLALDWREAPPDAVQDVELLTDELVSAVRAHRLLLEERPAATHADLRDVDLAAVAETLRKAVQHHPAAVGKTIDVSVRAPAGAIVRTEPTLLRRVVVNMLVNALEATRPGGAVRLDVSDGRDGTAFRVWNPGAIPAAVVPRVFQRYFTTKPGLGRGQGTYAMKLFGEAYLGGTVRFDTSPRDGTTFEVLLPRAA